MNYKTDLESLEKQVREFADRISRIKQKLLLKKQEEFSESPSPSGQETSV